MIILEQSEKLDGTIVQTIRLEDGTEIVRECPFECSLCGAYSDKPFPEHAISCMREECEVVK